MTAVSATTRLVRGLSTPFLDLLPITGVAISVLDQERKISTIHASDDTVARLEELHFDLGEGPLFDTVAQARPVLIPDIRVEKRWPIFAQSTLTMNVGALFVFPLMLGAACVGAAFCYRTQPGPLDAAAVETASGLSRAIAGPTFRHAILLAGVEDADADSPIEMRREVHQATGMVLLQLDVSATDAFARMRAYAFSNGVSLRDVARDVISRRLDFSTVAD
jgi:GAF domain-containing protein